MKFMYKLIIVVSVIININMAFADTLDDVFQLQKRWAEVNYTLAGKEQKRAFEDLVKQAEITVSQHSDSVEALIWRGVIKASYAGAKSAIDFSAMSLAKSAKTDFETALLMDERALDGASYTNLGVLYSKVPGWPIGFGDDDKAKSFLEKSLSIDAEGIENNYFYADYLIDQGHYAEAEKYLLKAQNAPVRLNRPIADKGRQDEISNSIKKVQMKLQNKQISNASITDRR